MKISPHFFQRKGKKGFALGLWDSLKYTVLIAVAMFLIYVIVKAIMKKILFLYS